MTDSIPDRVIVIGGGVAGVSTASALRTEGFCGSITLIERADLPYDRPPLSKDYLTGALDVKQLALQPAEWYDAQDIDLIRSTGVVSIVPGGETVDVITSEGRTLTGDQVVLATGGRALVPAIPGLSGVAEAGRLHVLRDVEHADRLRSAMQPGARLLVVGAGLIGAEITSTAVDLGCNVVLVDPLDPPLTAAGSAVASWLHSEHSRRGIDTRTTTLVSVENTDAGVLATLGDGTIVVIDVVLVGVGMVPNTALADAAGLDVDRGVLVDERQVSSHPRVLAVGDAAQRRGSRPAEHWEAAQHDGRRAAATLLGTPPPATGAAWWWSDRHGVHVEGVGEMHEPDDRHQVVVRGALGEPPFSVFTIADGKVVGAVSVDDSNAVRAARRLIDRGIVVDPDRLADTDTDLRKLVRS